MATIDFGISLYSYTQEYTKNQFDLETCIQRCSLHGAKQLEIVGSQMLKSYPYVTEQEANEVKALCQKYDVELLSYGANTDKGLRSDRDLNDDELFHMSLIDLQSAHRLGCKIMRAQYMLTPTIFAKLARYAEAYGIKVGIEIHNPETPSSTMVLNKFS